MKDCCEGVEFTDPVAQVHVEDDCTVVVELDGVGAQGPPGTAATVNVGTTSTLSAGSPATVANSGTQNAAILDFGIPEGPQGPAATIAVGTTSTLAPGSPATVGNSGTSSAAIFDFGIPEGQQGLQGLTGPPGIEVDATPPVDTTILWADTTEPGDQVIPPGGGTGDVLAKVSSNDYDSGWVTLGLDDLSDVDLTGVGDDDILQFDSALGVFLPVPVPSSLPTGGTTGQVLVKASGTDYDTAWDDRAKFDHLLTFPTSGAWQKTPFLTGQQNTELSNADRLHFTPFVAVGKQTITDIAGQVVTGAAGAVIRYGIFLPNANLEPGVLLAQATVDASSAGFKVASIGPVDVEGLYFIGAAPQGSNVIYAAATWTLNPIGYETATPPISINTLGTTSHATESGVFASNPILTIDLVARRRLHVVVVRYA
jgi:hypothetical protein